MRVILVVPDMVESPAKGYQVRTAAFESYLRRSNDVRVVVARGGRSTDIRIGAETRPLARGIAVAAALLANRPLQTALFDGLDVATRALSVAAEIRPDVVAVSTERLPITTLALAERWPTVLDVVDAQAGNMELRAEVAGGIFAALWRHEAYSFTHVTPVLRRSIARIVVAAARERRFYPNADVVPVGSILDGAPRPVPQYDVGLTGNLGYWPNVDAAVQFCVEIVPRIRSSVAGARFVVAGRRANHRVRDACARARVTLLGDVPDMHSLLRSVRLAVAPVRYATGNQLKVAEALAAGTPILIYRQVADGFNEVPRGALVCEDSEAMASLATEILLGHRKLDASRVGIPSWDDVSSLFERILREVAMQSHKTLL